MGVVDDFRETDDAAAFSSVAADIHAGGGGRNRLEAFEHLDVGGGVAGLGAGSRAAAGLRRCPALLAPACRTGRCPAGVLDVSFQWFRHRFFICCAALKAQRIGSPDYATDELKKVTAAVPGRRRAVNPRHKQDGEQTY